MSTVPSYARTFFECIIDRPWNPVTLRQLFTSALQVHWENPQHHLGTVGTDELGCLQYAPEGDSTVLPVNTLAVSPTYTFDEKKPFQGIYVGVGGLKLSKLVVDNFAGMSADNSETDTVTGAELQLSFKHVHRSPDTALLMATSTNVFLHALRQHLKGAPDFKRMDPAASNDAVQIEKSTERYFQVDIVWTLAFNYRVSISLESHRLKKYGMSLTESD